ncbi:HAMP domain-containing sensor histidine kinase [Aestuariicoccus sp. MJ-SS9]|nr:HAMP domain-containing sensor histidine kinase [Aestuariicoccus sp. MJ-SS9]MDU8909783.1 HAMP domain-containing sensor histidine kinase [Aestuariicoccus sp. MJ-SS9]
MARPFSLRAIGTLFVAAAFLTGVLATWMWMQSNAGWRAHGTQAFVAGVTTYNALQNNTLPSGDVAILPLSDADQALARAGAFNRIAAAPQAARLTTVPILADAENIATGEPLTLVILSPDLVYRLSALPIRDGQTAAETTGEVFRLLASYCSDPVVIARMGDAPWVRIDGGAVWGCADAPSDQRLIAAMGAVIALAMLFTATLNTSADFTHFADQLRSRRRLGGPTSYDIPGPRELQDIVAAVNSYLETERAQLESRAAVLSGVSHDLGTPATRLRLRTALIQDAELREKLEADIDSMTGMIDSVLTYTRAEMSAEPPRKLSLTALIDAIVADYEDMGRDVTLRAPRDVIVHGGRSVFMSRQGQTVVAGDRDVIVTGRPIALQRAVTNLIDNALKYGRRATVQLETDSDSATIVVEDEGSDSSAAEIEALMAPFRRGDNTATVDGYGLGLTIVATIAQLHGGALAFEDGPTGLRVRLTIQRG